MRGWVGGGDALVEHDGLVWWASGGLQWIQRVQISGGSVLPRVLPRVRGILVGGSDRGHGDGAIAVG